MGKLAIAVYCDCNERIAIPDSRWGRSQSSECYLDQQQRTLLQQWLEAISKDQCEHPDRYAYVSRNAAQMMKWLVNIRQPLDAKTFEIMNMIAIPSGGWNDDSMVLTPRDAELFKLELETLSTDGYLHRSDLYPYNNKPDMQGADEWTHICNLAITLNSPIVMAYGL